MKNEPETSYQDVADTRWIKLALIVAMITEITTKRNYHNFSRMVGITGKREKVDF